VTQRLSDDRLFVISQETRHELTSLPSRNSQQKQAETENLDIGPGRGKRAPGRSAYLNSPLLIRKPRTSVNGWMR